MMRDILVMDCEDCGAFWITLKSDCNILFTTTAGEGLTMLSENVGLVFLNLRLPDMDSLEVLRQIKKEYPSTAVIIITSCGTEQMCMEAFRNGARDYIRKPLKAEEILQKIRMLPDTNDISQRRRHVSLSTETTPEERYPDIPYNLVVGVLKVRDFIAQNYSESLSLFSACKMASLCKTYFCRTFKCITGHSLRSYHHVVRVRIAEELLQDKRLSVTEVALRLGYDDSNYFSTIYKKITGISPRQRQTSYINLYSEKVKAGAPEIAGNIKHAWNQKESEYQSAMREWQDSYYNLYREKEASGKSKSASDMKYPGIQSDTEFESILREWQDSYYGTFIY